MSTSKYLETLCCLLLVFALLLSTVLCAFGGTSGGSKSMTMNYQSGLFDYTKVHSIDIVMDDWDGFIETCENEEYVPATVVIDGEKVGNVGIRAKGNTSLSSVSSMGSDRYSFKIEFDQYENGKNYQGLDKLVLNNLIQDNSMMKDFITYQMMGQFGVSTSLCSYAYLTVNGEDWGLYLALEAVEESFLQRNYGTNFGDLYKPDSLSFGGGRGNGKDFKMEDFDFDSLEKGDDSAQRPSSENKGENSSNPFGGNFTMPGGFDMGNMPQMPNQSASSDSSNPFGGNFTMPEGFSMGNMPQMPNQSAASDSSNPFGGNFTMPEGFSMGNMPNMDKFDPSEMFGGGGGGFGGFGMGSGDVKLQYIDDDADSYSNIFSSAKTAVTKTDQNRLISSLKDLSSFENLESVLNMDEVLRYFVAHNFVVNGDSYTGSMIHNYYLYEEDGKLSMIPWDYNLAFGTFQGGNATSAVNDPIDSPLSVSEDRPMAYWMFSSEEYTQLYHQYFSEFMEQFFSEGQIEALIRSTAELIAPYVEKDPTKFCTYEEFERGVEALSNFCQLRAESVAGQLDGSIPSTDAGQSADSSALIDASSLTVSDMGTMGGFGGNRGDRNNRGEQSSGSKDFGGFGNAANFGGGKHPDSFGAKQ